MLCRGSRGYARAMRTMLTVLLMLAAPLSGRTDGLDDYLATLPPMDAGLRANFDRAARSMYRADCECLTYIANGRVMEVKLPLNDTARRILIESLKRGHIIPFGPKGDEGS